MKVRVYFYANHEARDPSSADVESLPPCDLHECFPDDSRDEHGNSDFLAALEELKRAGRVWVGGGAHPLVLLTAAGDQP